MYLKFKLFIVFIFLTFIGLLIIYYTQFNYNVNQNVLNTYQEKNESIIENKNEINDKKIQNEVFENIKSELIKYFDKYVILKGDTLSSIANKHGIPSYKDLIIYNSLLGVEFDYANRNIESVSLQTGYKMYVPKYGMLGLIESKINELKKFQYTLELNKKINLGDSLDLLSFGYELYPNFVKGLGVETLLKGFIEAQKREFDPYLPRIVDVQWQTTVSCANLIRTLLAFSVDKEKLTEKEKAFFQAQGLDAWILPVALEEIGYIQKFNLMNNFSEYYVGTPYPVPKENQKNYDEDIIKVGKYLETSGVPGSILPLYFRYSDYTKVIANYNRKREEKHYNTHQSVLAGVDTISFQARNVGIVKNGAITKFDDLEIKEISVFDFLTNFVQQRGDYGMGSLMLGTKKIVQANLITYQSLINIKVNGVATNLSEEFSKQNDKMLLIKPDDNIEIYGPIMIDGIHMLSSPDESRRKNMNARTRFYFEFMVIGNFLPSELLEPQNNVLGIGVKNDDLITELRLKGVYSINIGDTVESAIKSKIKVYEKEEIDKLDKNNPNYLLNYDKILNYFYAQQVKALKITGYMQSENDINSGSFNINAPIPYFDPENISLVFEKYVSNMNDEVTNGDQEIYLLKNFVQITTFPLDSYKTILNRIKEEMKIHLNDEGLENMKLLFDFNELQQRKFLDNFLNKSEKTRKFISKDILNGKISEGITMILSLKEIDKIILDISKETYLPDLQLNPADEFAINLVLNLVQNKNIVENILYMESYIPVGSIGARRLVKQFLENNSFLQQGFYIFGKGFSTRISSYGDFQLRLTNLYKGINEEGLNKNQLLKAFSYLEKKEFIDYVSKTDNITKRRIKSDIQLVDEINFLLLEYDNVDEEDKIDYREDIISKLEKILVLDDGTGKNVVGKIIGASLLNEKINLHFQKLNGILQASGQNLSDTYNNKDSMESYEKITILINNLGELNVVYGLAENYLIRIFDILENKTGKKYTYPKLKTTSTLGQFVYGRTVFLEHISVYKKILLNIKTDIDTKYDSNDKEYLLLNSLLVNLGKYLDLFSDINNKKSAIENIYDMFRNKNIKTLMVLLNNGKDTSLITSILPLKSEFSGVDFRDIFFRYINTREIERKGPGFLSKIFSLLR